MWSLSGIIVQRNLCYFRIVKGNLVFFWRSLDTNLDPDCIIIQNLLLSIVLLLFCYLFFSRAEKVIVTKFQAEQDLCLDSPGEPRQPSPTIRSWSRAVRRSAPAASSRFHTQIPSWGSGIVAYSRNQLLQLWTCWSYPGIHLFFDKNFYTDAKFRCSLTKWYRI